MNDSEVARLRRLRVTALRVRAVALALGSTTLMQHNPLLDRARCAAWRVARIVSGRLRAHPYARFQKDAGVGAVLWNSLVAVAVALRARSQPRALLSFDVQLRQLARQLDRARAFTWATDLSDSFGRSQNEIRALVSDLEYATHNDRGRIESTTVAGAQPSSGSETALEADWPYLAL
jgi:hypothetical protein